MTQTAINLNKNSTYTCVKLMYNKLHNKPTICCTADQLAEMCYIMEALLPGTTVDIDPVIGGGIKFSNTQYKSIRFHYIGVPRCMCEDSEGNFILTNRDGYMTIILDSYDSAPQFTEEELSAFIEALSEVVLAPSVLKQADFAGWHWYKKPWKQVAKYYKEKERYLLKQEKY